MLHAMPPSSLFVRHSCHSLLSVARSPLLVPIMHYRNLLPCRATCGASVLLNVEHHPTLSIHVCPSTLSLRMPYYIHHLLVRHFSMASTATTLPKLVGSGLPNVDAYARMPIASFEAIQGGAGVVLSVKIFGTYI